MQRVLAFVRFSHTIFALPFALGAMLVAARGVPSWETVLLILLAMVFARTAAMAFNRVADWEIDKQNPRTAGRHRLVSQRMAVGLVIGSATAFVATCWFINSLCFFLSPVALFIVFFYSLTKRFTAFTQLFLGLALAISPLGAWLAVRGTLDLPPFILAVGVVFWVAGFDLIYAIQDYEFDKRHGLGSMVVRYGVNHSLRIAQVMHAILLVCLVFFGVSSGRGPIYFAAMVLVIGALIYEHQAAARLELTAINQAFFQSNAFVSVVFVFAVAADVFL
jgi:4-hydroxybenzoate polyprenyltransferase